jgi:hypothetical protein
LKFRWPHLLFVMSSLQSWSHLTHTTCVLLIVPSP